MEFIRTDLEGIVLIKPDVHVDQRGFLLESYSRDRYVKGGIAASFMQDNHSFSVKKSVIRGLHFQVPPAAQNKLVRVTSGAICDVVVDLRKSSSTFGKWLSFDLSARNFRQLYVPAGFAHGFCTLEDNTEVQYKVDCPYSPTHDSGIRWNDPDIAIVWPIKEPIISDKDGNLPYLKNFASPF
ncbi:MAG: dTDP-4-dehydrorhamnose 3,5-epimerase [Chitinispirillaceae bacterium]|jgi:dTDP-4-dehydrorhamnose 3,5-epimerase